MNLLQDFQALPFYRAQLLTKPETLTIKKVFPQEEGTPNTRYHKKYYVVSFNESERKLKLDKEGAILNLVDVLGTAETKDMEGKKVKLSRETGQSFGREYSYIKLELIA